MLYIVQLFEEDIILLYPRYLNLIIGWKDLLDSIDEQRWDVIRIMLLYSCLGLVVHSYIQCSFEEQWKKKIYISSLSLDLPYMKVNILSFVIAVS